MIAVNNELSLFDTLLGQKPQIVVVNKVDVPEVKSRVNDIKEAFREAGVEVRFISAATGEGVAVLMHEAWQKLQSMTIPEVEGEEPKKVFRPQPKGAGLTIHKEGDVFVVEAPGLERMVSDTGEATPELQLHVQRQLTRIGLNRALGRAGAKFGDKVRCGIVEWEWMP